MYKAKSAGKIGLCQEAEAKSDGRFGLRQVAEAKSDGRFGLCQVAEAKSDGRFGLRQVAEAKSDGKFGLCQVAEAKSDGRFGLRQEAEAKSDGRFGLIHPTRVYLTILTKKHRKRLSFRPIKRNKHEYLEGNTICCIFAPANIMDMKKSLYLLLLFALALFNTGCRHTVAYPTVLSEADSLCMTAPTEAVALLDSIAPQMQQSSDAVRHYYDLLTVKARDKAFLPHTSDSLILDVLHYYEANNDRAILPEAYYYAGRVTSDMGDAPQALKYYQNSLTALDNPLCETEEFLSKHPTLRGILYAQIAYLLKNQYLYAESERYFTLAYRADSLNNDTTNVMLDLYDLGQIHSSMKQYDKALPFFQMSESLASMKQDTSMICRTMGQTLMTMIRMGQVNEITHKYAEFQKLSHHNETSLSSLVHAVVLDRLGKRDSSAVFYQRLLANGTLRQKVQSSLWLANFESERHNGKASIDLLNMHAVLYDSLSEMESISAVSSSNALYGYQQKELKSQELQFKALLYHQRLVFAEVIAAVLFAALVVLLIWHHNKIKKQKQRLNDLLEEQERRQSQIIEAKQARFSELLSVLNESDERHEQLKREYECLKLQIQKAELEKSISESFYDQWLESSVAVMINSRIEKGSKLTEDDWAIIESQYNAMNPDFIRRLRSIAQYSLIEWRITLLVKVNTPPTSIATLLCKTNSSVSNCRRRLYKKVFLKDGTASDWDKFVQSL